MVIFYNNFFKKIVLIITLRADCSLNIDDIYILRYLRLSFFFQFVQLSFINLYFIVRRNVFTITLAFNLNLFLILLLFRKVRELFRRCETFYLRNYLKFQAEQLRENLKNFDFKPTVLEIDDSVRWQM